MSKAVVIPVIRELVRCYQAFEQLSSAHIRGLDLTPPQFDIVVTLGNTPGLTFKELGSRTLITKGTLTGVVTRLEQKGLLSRRSCPRDGRSTIVCLTPQGEAVFRNVFEPHLAHIAPAIESLPPESRDRLAGLLQQLGNAFARQHADQRRESNRP